MPQRGHPSQEGLWAPPYLLMAHEPEPEADGLLDLSFLTEEEQEAIADVLKRDAHLRQLEEGRVSKLRASLADPRQLKILTGDWFQEARAQRHHQAHLGSDLVRASIRRKKSSKGEQALGSNRETKEAAGKETEEELEPRRGPPERLSEAEGPDFPSPYVPPKASDHEEEPQAQTAPRPGGTQVYEEEAGPEPEPPAGEEEPRPAQVGGAARGGPQDPERSESGERAVRPSAVGAGRGKQGAPDTLPPQVQAASKIVENGEEAPAPGPSLDRVLSSSSSVSSLNSSTASHLAGPAPRRLLCPPTSHLNLPLPSLRVSAHPALTSPSRPQLSGSQLSLSGEADAVQVRGSVHFALGYERDAAELRVQVIQCQGLAAARRRRSDPYVKSYLLPDKQSKRKTAVKKRNLNPVFNETLRVRLGGGPVHKPDVPPAGWGGGGGHRLSLPSAFRREHGRASSAALAQTRECPGVPVPILRGARQDLPSPPPPPVGAPAALRPASGVGRRASGVGSRTEGAACPQYSVPQAELAGRVLSLSVWHRESLGRNVFLGEVEVPLDTWDWDSEAIWLPLQPRVSPSPDDLPSRGRLSLSLKYVPAGSEGEWRPRETKLAGRGGAGLPLSGELHFWVKEAQDLVPLRSGSLDTYIQCSVLPDDSRASRQRTRVVRRSLSPVFNHTMVYDGFGPADLRQACAELSLWDHGALVSRQLGATRLSLGTGSSYGLQVPWMDSTPEEKQLWQTVLERPCEWVDGLVPLRTNLVPRT
ncbi:hypothetical protein QTO34_018887 [Cnephaeus nilssonii]|uniref:Synaptotagmin-like protein 1 n=1 Tax=Cnephaeus nilssonii TaxID=3371016 RepID=A0AA40LQT8_CNENI|nr:hypothetical protein QTO34_018887 [Eptesicus nilssonii]